MPSALMYEENMFVVLEADKPEVFLTAEELLAKLQDILEHYTEELPRNLQRFSSLAEQARSLRDNFCELDMGDNSYLQWYAVRLEK
ncbi:MAG: chlororespiratory reduction protein 7 [Woronichinia naegeliana WA131]|jgi:hypothetical protein|uniref:Chlororespiratory reduction protein 7 n=1 Tax=Woronichinia naegeliana WA131 TaxID=2824559 RepID=A0A977KVN0_9CYAN|nr:MAG: chlororespiratory reduction protein 7 [Woronichinia naegeliana WA131]